MADDDPIGTYADALWTGNDAVYVLQSYLGGMQAWTPLVDAGHTGAAAGALRASSAADVQAWLADQGRAIALEDQLAQARSTPPAPPTTVGGGVGVAVSTIGLAEGGYQIGQGVARAVEGNDEERLAGGAEAVAGAATAYSSAFSLAQAAGVAAAASPAAVVAGVAGIASLGYATGSLMNAATEGAFTSPLGTHLRESLADYVGDRLAAQVHGGYEATAERGVHPPVHQEHDAAGVPHAPAAVPAHGGPLPGSDFGAPVHDFHKQVAETPGKPHDTGSDALRDFHKQQVEPGHGSPPPHPGQHHGTGQTGPATHTTARPEVQDGGSGFAIEQTLGDVLRARDAAASDASADGNAGQPGGQADYWDESKLGQDPREINWSGKGPFITGQVTHHSESHDPHPTSRTSGSEPAAGQKASPGGDFGDAHYGGAGKAPAGSDHVTDGTPDGGFDGAFHFDAGPPSM